MVGNGDGIRLRQCRNIRKGTIDGKTAEHSIKNK